MLILPLHRRLSRRNFPFATVALVLINAFVFLFLQQADTPSNEQAVAYYHASQLPALEFPAYRSWLDSHQRNEQLTMLTAFDNDDALTLRTLQRDEEFLDDLQAERVITSGDEHFAEWKEQRSTFEHMWYSSFTERHVVRFGHFEPGRMFSAMFLHGSFGHLFGNMLFLVVLGLLVEGALGSALFVALYLLGGMGSELASVAWRANEIGSGLGASGAIAALMGAYCVLWGRRKVRFFWWFFVLFDYIKAPALILLPFWLGWEIFNLMFNSGAHVAFEAHAGGIVSGALLALLVRRLNWQRDEFLDEDVHAERAEQQVLDLTAAKAALGRLDLDAARRAYEALDQQQPGNLDVLIGLYRCARYSKNMQEVHKAALRLFQLRPGTGDGLRQFKAAHDDYLKACNGISSLPNDVRLGLAQTWLRMGQVSDADAMLRELIGTEPQLPGLLACWWQLANRHDISPVQQSQRLKLVVECYPGSPESTKARFMLRELAMDSAAQQADTTPTR